LCLLQSKQTPIPQQPDYKVDEESGLSGRCQLAAGFWWFRCSYANQFPGKTRRLSYANIPESILENSNDGKMKRLEISMPLDG
jgi:hypothetical protein